MFVLLNQEDVSQHLLQQLLQLEPDPQQHLPFPLLVLRVSAKEEVYNLPLVLEQAIYGQMEQPLKQ